MTSTATRSAPAATYMVHLFGRGLVDEGRCYAVERYKCMTNGEVRRWPGEARGAGKCRPRPKPEVASYEAVREMRPAYNEIIVCTALGCRSGVQLFGWAATGMFGDRMKRR